MKLDIFTLFPEAFDWFQSQRSVRNALAQGNELRLFDYRDTTPLGAGQVDDAPYGGGAGMVLRVDVVDAALRAFERLPEIDGRACRERVRRCFSVYTMVEAYEAVYATIFEIEEKRQHAARHCQAI